MFFANFPDIAKSSLRHFQLIALLLLLVLVSAAPAKKEPDDSVGTIRKRGVEMAEKIENLLREKYYDPNFHGVDIKEKFLEARRQIK
jgi:hypothetical protein